MPKYKIVMQYSDGTNEEEDNVFDIEEDAEEGNYAIVTLKQSGTESPSASVIVRLVGESTSNITSVEVTISTGIGYKNENRKVEKARIQ